MRIKMTKLLIKVEFFRDQMSKRTPGFKFTNRRPRSARARLEHIDGDRNGVGPVHVDDQWKPEK